MERLGHSTINVTLGTYGHLFPTLEKRIDDALADRYRGTGGGLRSGDFKSGTSPELW